MQNPFAHEHLEVKHQFLTLAQSYYAKGTTEEDAELSIAYKFAAALLYMNHADYLAQHMAHAIKYVSENAVSEYFHASISIISEKKKDLNLKESINILKKYEFNGKNELIDSLGRVKSARNKIAHTILKLPPEKIDEIDKAMDELKEQTEKVIEITDKIRLGMPPKNLKNLIESLTPNE